MKKILEWAGLLAALLVLTGCAGKEPVEPKWEDPLYRAVVYNSGEDESAAKYLEIAQRSQELLAGGKDRCICYGCIQLSGHG